MEKVTSNAIFPWQQEQWNLLVKQVRNQRLPHALLITGNQGLGKFQFSHSFAKLLLCENNSNFSSFCNQCHSCQLYSAETHPDFKIIQPEENSDTIKIDQIREVVQFFNKKALQQNYKIVIIYPTEALNQAAANALLKTLEEPPLSKNLLLLVTHHPALLLATIRSRCQEIQFKSPAKADAINWLQQKHSNEKNTELALILAEGAPLLASKFLQENTLLDFTELLSDLEKLIRQELNIVSIANKWQAKNIDNTLYLLQFLLARLIELKLANNNRFLQNSEISQQILNVAQHTLLARLFACLDMIYEQKQHLQAKINLNNQMLLEKIFSFF